MIRRLLAAVALALAALFVAAVVAPATASVVASDQWTHPGH